MGAGETKPILEDSIFPAVVTPDGRNVLANTRDQSGDGIR
jgi:hypothetical protein